MILFLFFHDLDTIFIIHFQAVSSEFQNESAVALAAAATRHFQEAEQIKGQGGEHW